MKRIFQLISFVALGMTILPCLLYFGGLINHYTMNAATLVGTIVWFIATPLWMGRDLAVDAKEVEI